MKRRSSRILSALLALAMLFSFGLAVFSADAQNRSESIISIDPLATDDDIRVDSENGRVTLKSGQALRLTYNGYMTENTTIQWSSSKENVASIAEDGTVTTGSSCKVFFFGIIGNIPWISSCTRDGCSTVYLPLFGLHFPYFNGNTDITLTVTDPVTDPETGETTEQVQTATIHLTVEHTFKEWLRSLF